MNKEYLGDAVYSSFDGYYVILTTEDGIDNLTNTIFLEPEVMRRLVEYTNKLKNEIGE